MYVVPVHILQYAPRCPWCFQVLPVGGLCQDLVHTDTEGVVLPTLPDVLLVDPELGRRHRLALWDAGEVEAVLPPVVAMAMPVLIRVCFGSDNKVSLALGYRAVI